MMVAAIVAVLQRAVMLAAGKIQSLILEENQMVVLGYVLIILGFVGLGLITLRVFSREKSLSTVKTYGYAQDEKFAQTLPTDTLSFNANSKEKLKVVKSGQTVELVDEPGERAVMATVALHEMTQLNPPHSPWTKTGVASRAIVLAGDIWILKVPGREGGKPAWFKTTEIETFPLQSFYKGGDEPSMYGPARKFKMNDQTSAVPYTLPNNLVPGVTWNIVDIGRFDAEVEGNCENVESKDCLYFVTSREKDGDRFLLYLDARKGEAKGSGGLFLGTPFEPDTEIMGML
jgi:hypothetical protein